MWQSQLRISLLAAALLAAAAAQAPAIAGNLPSFDVVSIRAWAVGTPGSWDPAPRHGRWTAGRLLTPHLIGMAFDIPDARIVGLPGWAKSAYWHIIAKTRPDITEPEFRQMLQSMLASRFQFEGHWELRTMNARALRAAPGGVKVHPATNSCIGYGTEPAKGEGSCGVVRPHFTFPDPSQDNAGPIETMVTDVSGISVTMADVVRYLGMNGEPMVDQTGYHGKFDFDMKYTLIMRKVEHGMRGDDYQHKLAVALREQAGLVIAETKAPVRVLVVDHVAEPTAN